MPHLRRRLLPDLILGGEASYAEGMIIRSVGERPNMLETLGYLFVVLSVVALIIVLSLAFGD